MAYAGIRVAITGHSGFLGKNLVTQLQASGADVLKLRGDVRDPATFSQVDHSCRYLFHFGAPSSQVLFNRDPERCIDVTVTGFLNAVKAARRVGAKLVFPSTGILSAGSSVNEYARCKKICEDVLVGSRLLWAGVRLFAAYGPGEVHKHEYASVPYLLASDMNAGRSPVIYGDGSQVRDFIYITDAVNAILKAGDIVRRETVDVGSGSQISFNDIYEYLAHIIEDAPLPTYVDAPSGYVESTLADSHFTKSNGLLSVPIFRGLEQTVRSLNVRSFRSSGCVSV